MDNITLGQFKDVIVYIGTLSTAIGVLYKLLMSGIKKIMQPIEDELKEEKGQRLKSELTTFMYLAELETISQEQKMLAHEDFDMYINLGKNSYIKERFNKLMEEGKI